MKGQLSLIIACTLLLAACAERQYASQQPTRSTAQPGVTSITETTVGPGSASSGLWIDKITEYVMMQQALSRQGDYGPYLEELRKAKEARLKGDWVGQYQTMNRFIDKLDAREGGIPPDSARNIREYTYLVEPRGLHNLERDVQIHPEITKWQERAARAREESERSF